MRSGTGTGTGTGTSSGASSRSALLNFVERRALDTFSRLHARVPAVARPMAWAARGLVLLGVKPYDVAFTIDFGF